MIHLIKWSLDHILKSLCLLYPQCKTLGASFDLNLLYFTFCCPVMFALWYWHLFFTTPLLHLYFLSSCHNLHRVWLHQGRCWKHSWSCQSMGCRWGFALAVALGKLSRCLGQNCFPALLRLLAVPEGQVRKHRFKLDHGSRSTPCQCDRHCTALSSHSCGSAHTPLVTRISQPACPAGFRDSFIKLSPSLKWTAFPRVSHSPAPAGSENSSPVVSFHVWRPISPIWFPFL